ncbi:DUF1289 domain-containing protein [Aromatoleum diolicum]|uniref:DUF1289 domain-containing protein n=1 Tax=Aromatoleum diolicum TaxID=75796 RepID=A0ABX1QBR9_9RHOO|nr:DUF1289 domain-containing protein [Aromatoleum diolicum]NMG75832.1 DUF1289 domain-containing protein [Aromatoleum diolicum]
MTVASPCINICRMNADTGLCEGCFRSLDEIASWSRHGDGEKRRILDAVAQRRAALGVTSDAAPLAPTEQP